MSVVSWVVSMRARQEPGVEAFKASIWVARLSASVSMTDRRAVEAASWSALPAAARGLQTGAELYGVFQPVEQWSAVQTVEQWSAVQPVEQWSAVQTVERDVCPTEWIEVRWDTELRSLQQSSVGESRVPSTCDLRS